MRFNNNDLNNFIELKRSFVKACNDVSEVAVREGSRSRTLMHSLAYESIRTKYPELGSQLCCNAIYAVTKIYKQVDVAVKRRIVRPIYFADSFPLIYDSRTVSFFEDRISIYTPKGRMHFSIDNGPELLTRIKKVGIKEVLMYKTDADVCLDIRFKNFGNCLEVHQDDCYMVAA